MILSSSVLSGRDCLVVAKTGSGKTVAFLLPMIIHISDQREVEKGEGPVALVVAPTRELAEQIHKEARKFAKAYDYRISAAFGGLSKFDQVKALKAGCEAAICTPGRLIDLVKMKACSLGRVTFCVMDEADRMFEMGFEGQIRSILSQIRPLKQLVLFTATMPRKVEALANDALTRALRISVGIGGVANSDVTQFVEVFKQEEEKLDWLRLHIQSFVDQGEVIVFTSTHKKVDALVLMLQAMGIKAAGESCLLIKWSSTLSSPQISPQLLTTRPLFLGIHGEMDQYSRSHVLDSFRQGGTHVLIATDIASRGLDIKSLTTVISIDAAKDVETHIHRVGRTGRAGDKTGQAITLLLDPIDARFASGLAQTFVLGGVTISTSLHELTLKDNGRCNGHWGMGGGRGGGRGRGRRPTRSLGGLGLGFSAPSSSGASLGSSASVSIRQGVEFVPLPGFERSHAALGQLATTSSLPPPPALPPGPPPPPLTFPPGPPPSFFQAIQPSSMQANPAEEFLPPPPPLPPTQPQAANPVTTFQAGRFKSQFVRSGVTSVESNVEIIASRAPSSTAIPSLQESKVPPVPVPVHLQPMYLKHQTFGRYSKPSPADHDKEAQAAIEAARQIAARLGAGGGAGAVPHPPALNASDAVLRAQAAAQAIADRLAAAAQAEQR